MKDTIITERLKTLATASDLQQTNAAKEVIQEFALLGLARCGFFKVAAFHGGTCFRIIDGLDRFSEDLDFSLLEADANFQLTDLVEPLQAELKSWGLNTEAVDRSKVDSVIKKMFLKESSLGCVLSLRHPLKPNQKLHIKIELDVNPPQGAETRNCLCEFPTDYYVRCHTQPTMFAGKIHALLRRPYPKGRDWYDFTKYISRKTMINLAFLKNALMLNNSQEQAESLTIKLVIQMLSERLESLSIETLIHDIRPFVLDDTPLSLWSHEFFRDKMNKIGDYHGS